MILTRRGRCFTRSGCISAVELASNPIYSSSVEYIRRAQYGQDAARLMEAYLKSRELRRTRGRPRKGAESNEETLLDAALAAFAEYGFDKASLRSIAAAAGVDVALISYRYGSKFELWKAVVEKFARETISSLASPQVDLASVSSGSRLDIVIEQLIVLACQRPQFPQFIVKELVKGEESDQVEFIHNVLTEPLRQIV